VDCGWLGRNARRGPLRPPDGLHFLRLPRRCQRVGANRPFAGYAVTGLDPIFVRLRARGQQDKFVFSSTWPSL
jgi:hypothetical protein